MTPQEQQLLKDLTDRVNSTVLSEKDPDAETFLQQSLSRNPDATYIMAQTILVQQYALDQAKKQLSQAQLDLDRARQQAQQPRHATSFLGSLLGRDEPAPPPPAPAQSQYQPMPNYAPAPQQAYAPAYGGSSIFGGGMQQGGGGSFLRSAMTTATGVAAGALAFEGIESLMHGFGQHAGFGSGSGFGEFGGAGQPREEIVNNYYGDSASQHEHGGDLASRLSPDVEDRRDDGSSRAAFANTDDNSASDADSADDFVDDTSGSVDDRSFDDSSDTSSTDDSGF